VRHLEDALEDGLHEEGERGSGRQLAEEERERKEGGRGRTELLYCTMRRTRCVLRFVSFWRMCTKLIVEKKLRHE